jgi:hypothetical protein
MAGRWGVVLAVLALLGCSGGSGDEGAPTVADAADDTSTTTTTETPSTTTTTTTSTTTTTTTEVPFPPGSEINYEVLVSDEARPRDFTLDPFVATTQAELDHLWEYFGFGGVWQLLGPAPTVDFDRHVALAFVAGGWGCPPGLEILAGGDRLRVIEDGANMPCHLRQVTWSHLVLLDRAQLPERFVWQRTNTANPDHAGMLQEIVLPES